LVSDDAFGKTATWQNYVVGKSRDLLVFHLWNNPSDDTLSIFAITRSKEQTRHEAAFINRICSLHFCARSDPVGVGHAGRKP
jgi:hypothetical protein